MRQATITAALPGVTIGDHHIVVWTDIKDNIRESDITNNRLVSTDLMTVTIPELTPDVAFTDTITGEMVKRYYSVNVSAGLDLKVTLTSDVPEAWNEMYIAYRPDPHSI